MICASPLCHIRLHHWFGGHLPGTVDPTTRQPLEIKLAADLGVGAARVRHVVAVERHHVTEDVCARSCVCGTTKVLTFEWFSLFHDYSWSVLFRQVTAPTRVNNEVQTESQNSEGDVGSTHPRPASTWTPSCGWMQSAFWWSSGPSGWACWSGWTSWAKKARWRCDQKGRPPRHCEGLHLW